jgi:beta-glucanase (GH16 family)
MKTYFIYAFTIVVLAFGIWAFTTQKEGHELVWEDNFDSGVFPDAEKWNVITGNGCPQICGFGNNEAQYYTNHKQNVEIRDGFLIIRALRDTIGENYYTSAKLTSENLGDWETGKIEVRARLPKGRGTWPAIWMLPTLNRSMNWPEDGEIDIMEHVGYNQGWVFGTIHTQKFNHIKGTQKSDSIFVEDASEAFHRYILEWEKDEMRWYVDDKLYNTIPRNNESRKGWPFDNRFHLILNFAVGGNWGGKYGVDDSIWPQEFIVDYVRVYQND